MSIEQIKAEATALSDTDRKELIGFLLALGRKRTAEYWDRMKAKIEDHNPSHWVAEDDLDRA
ncbi:MAG TPA: hypothetical protein VK961_26020, partial [Chthoniobacter sp.]|nr:hypothetical protein [Chthoniobacter sp.]